MIGNAKIITGILFLSLLALAATAWVIAPSFAMVFAAPALVLAVVQWTAFHADSLAADRFFAWSDLAYYVMVGAVIGAGSILIPELDKIFALDAEITYSEAVEQLPQAREEAVDAATVNREFSESVSRIPDEVLGDCMARQAAEDLTRSFDTDAWQEDAILLVPDAPPGCEMPFAVLDGAARAWGEAAQTMNRVRRLGEVVDHGPAPRWVASDFFSAATVEFLLLKLFPTLILCGVMLKVGKTTLAIRKYSATG